MKLPRTAVTRVALAAIIIFAAITPLAAHHGWSSYEEAKTIELTGVIEDSGYSNPHGFIRVRVDGEKGKTWLVILAPPSRMEARGLPAERLKKGETASVVGYPHREKDDELRAERITIGGKTTELRQ